MFSFTLIDYYIAVMWFVVGGALITGLVLYKYIVTQFKTYTEYLAYWGEAFKQKLLNDGNLQLSKESLELENSMLKEELKEYKASSQLENSILRESRDRLNTELVELKAELNAKEVAYSSYKALATSEHDDLQWKYNNLIIKANSLEEKLAVLGNVKFDSSITLIEFCSSVDTILGTLKSMDSSYEIGIHNGVATITNTLLGTEKYPLIEPMDKGIVTMPKRDDKGRFLSFKKQQGMLHTKNMQ